MTGGPPVASIDLASILERYSGMLLEATRAKHSGAGAP